MNLREFIYKTKDNSALKADEDFRINLRKRIMNQIEIEENSKHSLSDKKQVNNFAFKNMFKLGFNLLLAVAAVSVISFVVINMNKEGISTPLSSVQAKEKLKEKVSEIVKEGKIIYQISYANLYGGDGEIDSTVEYRLWEDSETNLFRNEVLYSDFGKTYQVQDMDNIYWAYSEDEKELGKTKLVNTSMQTEEVWMVKMYQDFIDSDLFEIEEVGDQIVFTLGLDGGETEDGEFMIGDFMDKIYIDSETYSIEKMESYQEYNGELKLSSETIYNEIIYLDKTDELINELFVFNIEIPEDVTVIEEVMDQVTGEVISSNRDDFETDDELIDISIDSGVIENSRIKLPDMDGWELVVMDGVYEMYEQEETQFQFVNKEFMLEIFTEVFITGGGMGTPLEGVCESIKEVKSEELENGLVMDHYYLDLTKEIKEDSYLDLSKENVNEYSEYCPLEMIVLNHKENKKIWIGSVVKDGKTEFPMISGNSDDLKSSFISIDMRYSHDSYEMRDDIADEYLSWDSPILEEKLEEVKKIINNIVIKE